MMTFHSDLGDSAACALAHDQMVRDYDDYLRGWQIAHGYLPDPTPQPPRGTYHFCGYSRGWSLVSRADCPHCKLPAPLDAGPGIE